jgi:hypothetical protein
VPGFHRRCPGRSSTALLLDDERSHAVGADDPSEDDWNRTTRVAARFAPDVHDDLDDGALLLDASSSSARPVAASPGRQSGQRGDGLAPFSTTLERFRS